MRGGGSIAFYEIAATLIPALFVGSILLEKLQPSASVTQISGMEIAGLSRKQVEDVVRWLYPGRVVGWLTKVFVEMIFWGFEPWAINLVAVVLPLVAGWVVFAEIVALDAVVTRSSSAVHAWVVGGTLLGGALVVLLVLWLPWLRKLAATLKVRGKGAVALVAGPFLLGVGALAVFAALSITYVDQIFDAPTHPSGERIWLEHLIATSDYRIDKLDAEAQVSKAARERAKPHRKTQKAIERRECAELAELLRDEALQAPRPSPCLKI